MDRREWYNLSKFLRALFLFSIPFVLVAGILEFQLRKVVNHYQAKHDYFEQRRLLVEVLVLGTSQANFGIDADELGRPAFNLAMPSQSLVVDAQLVTKYISSLPKLKVVILPIDYLSMPHVIDGSIEDWRNHYYIRYFHIAGDGSWLDRYSPRNYSLIALYKPNIVFDFVKKGFHVNLVEHLHESGWDEKGAGLTASSTEQEALGLLATHHSMMSLDGVSGNRTALFEMIAVLRSHHVQVLLVTLPVQPAYRAHLDARYLAVMRETITMLRARYALPYFDYSADSRFNFSDFIDTHHLSSAGAHKFSRVLATEVLR